MFINGPPRREKGHVAPSPQKQLNIVSDEGKSSTMASGICVAVTQILLAQPYRREPRQGGCELRDFTPANFSLFSHLFRPKTVPA